MPQESVEIVVVGGGPAGTTAATLLARSGRTVRLLEKAQHPRFHIGESLLPSNLPILERLGVHEAVRQIGVRKPAAEFVSPSGERQAFPFADALGATPDHAYQVRRSEFDALLASNCVVEGVDLREGCEVSDVVLGRPGAPHLVRYLDEAGRCCELGARFVLDASGRGALLARRNRWQRRDRKHASAAVFSHFEGVTRREGEHAGNISVYWFEHGWVWMIPLEDGSMSVGAVCRPAYLKMRTEAADRFLLKTLAQIPDAQERMRDARAVAPTHVTGNYSYRSSRMSGPGYALIGDAYAFVDPVFSSGVYLAMNSAERAVPMVEAWLDEDRLGYVRHRAQFERSIQRKLSSFSWFIYRFTSPVMRRLFEAPRNDWQVAQAVVSMLAGDGDEHGPIRRRLLLFRIIYRVHALVALPTAVSAWWSRRRLNAAAFEEETLEPTALNSRR